jgi:hypothetical protein
MKVSIIVDVPDHIDREEWEELEQAAQAWADAHLNDQIEEEDDEDGECQ